MTLADEFREKIIESFAKVYAVRCAHITYTVRNELTKQFKITQKMGRYLDFKVDLNFNDITLAEKEDADKEGYKSYEDMVSDIIYVFLSKNNFKNIKVNYKKPYYLIKVEL